MGEVSVLSDNTVAVEYNGRLQIAKGKSRFETQWHNGSILWGRLLFLLHDCKQTKETHAEYMKLPKDQQDKIKDIGGFVGGHLKGGLRRSGSVTTRQILTLDVDFAPRDFWDRVTHLMYDSYDLPICAACVYSTHKHTPEHPRLRLIVPLDRPVTPEQYEAIARKVAEKIGIDFFDDSTYQPTRLMYWPSLPADVEPVFEYHDAPFLSADEILAEYEDWSDVSFWPMSSRVLNIPKRIKEKQLNPLEKRGAVGVFCRTYTVSAAIAAFLSDVYIPTVKEDRYTYAAGTSSSGLVVYEDDLFAYSNHSTDPAAGQLCNAFDLVRIHLFGQLDEEEGAKEGRFAPSFKAMSGLVADDPQCKRTAAAEAKASAADDFKEEADDRPWEEKLQRNSQLAVVPNAKNALLILRNDPMLSHIAYNELAGAVEVQGPVPWTKTDRFWRDADDAQLLMYVSTVYQVNFPDRILRAAFVKVCDDRSFNPLRQFIQALPEWDGIPRVETLLSDYLGAEDTPYVRDVTKKTLVGAVKRVLHPGCKFDTVLVLDGPPGIGKSTLLARLGGEWFTDNLSLADTKDKTAAEKIQGQWIVEIAELQGSRKADLDILKGFISRQVDEYRAAYGRVVERHPRTAIICGTTNATTGFLRDTTGNRRFWPVPVAGDGPLSVWSMTEETRLQIWAEAKEMLASGETPYLSAEMEKEAARMQQEALEHNELEGEVMEYLDTLLPENWYDLPISDRMAYFAEPDPLDPAREKGTMLRVRVCAREIFTECYGKSRNQWKKQDGYEIASIMAAMPGWERINDNKTIPGYGRQRAYVRTVLKDGTRIVTSDVTSGVTTFE